MYKVFKFLSEQTSLWEEMWLFMRLSWSPFLKAAGKDIANRLRFRSEFLLLGTTLITTILYAIQPEMTYLFAGFCSLLVCLLSVFHTVLSIIVPLVKMVFLSGV